MQNEQKPSQLAEDNAPEAMLPEPNLEPVVTEQNTTPAGSAKIPRWLRLGLIGLGVAAVLFLAGFLTDHFARYQPMRAEFDSTKLQLTDLEMQETALNDQLTTANSQIAGLESDKTGLQAELDAANMHLELLRAVREILAAHLALANADISGAKVALVNTPKRLENLKSVVAPVDAALAESMSKRLTMILAALGTDAETAKTDLALLATNLLNIEALLYK